MATECIAKVLIIGEAKVGKTSILTQFTDQSFSENLIPTLGIDYRIKRIKLDNKDIKLQIWDTAGQERFRSITQNFYKGAMGIILVFDLTDLASFERLSGWVDSITQYSGQDVCKILLGNKSDLPQMVPDEAIQQYTQKINIKFYKTSAKLATGISDAFLQVTRDINEKFFTASKISDFGSQGTTTPSKDNTPANTTTNYLQPGAPSTSTTGKGRLDARANKNSKKSGSCC